MAEPETYLDGIAPVQGQALSRANRTGLGRLQDFLTAGKSIAVLGEATSAPLYRGTRVLIDDVLSGSPLRVALSSNELSQLRVAPAAAAIDILRPRIDPSFWRRALERAIRVRTDPETGRGFTVTHECIVRCKFEGIVTTAFDPGIAHARATIRPELSAAGIASYTDEEALARWRTGAIFEEVEVPLLFAHGRHDEPQSLLLSTTDVAVAYRGSLGTVLRRLIDGRHLVWIGFSFLTLRDLLRSLDEAMPRDPDAVRVQHDVALLPWNPMRGHQAPDPPSLVRSIERRFNLNVVFYPATPGNNSFLDALLAEHTDTAASVASPTSPSALGVSARITSTGSSEQTGSAPPPPPRLLEALAKGDLAVFVGAGLPAAAGYPTWSGLVRDLFAWAEANVYLDDSLLASLRSSIGEGDLDSVADALAETVDHEVIVSYLRASFAARDVLPGAYSVLSRLPVTAALTSSFDSLLAATWPGAPRLTLNDGDVVLDYLSRRRLFILHVNGALDSPTSVQFGPSALDEFLAINPDVAQAMSAFLESRSVLFLGTEISEIEDFVRPLNVAARGRPRHYALFPAESATWRTHAQRLRRRFGIEIVPYAGDSHEQTLGFLSALEARLESRSGSPAESGADKLSRLVLEDIGPFDRLQLELHSGWNILLGDNGVGKSTILKAIGLVFAGDEGAVFGDRLLRNGASRGSIHVETVQGRVFHTELIRGTDTVQVRHAPGVRLETEAQVVLGVPPLRTLSWRRESSPSSSMTPRRPTASDVLPLLASEADPRLDSVKQRIVNCDYRMRASSVDGDEARADRLLLNDLVHAMEVLTDELAVSFDRVDIGSNAVVVSTIDGPLPIEALSQGAGSLIGWVSFLLERLHDTASSGEDPRQRQAIVLVDEVDAHLHPDWQQQLTRRLSRLFPNVQFIATTHSPLIVGGMQYQQVTALRRDGRRVTRVTSPGRKDDVVRGRADQLLTGRLFGLTTSIDMETRLAVGRYQELLGRDRSSEEEAEFNELQDLLEVRVPVGASTPSEQRARDFLDLLLRESAGQALPEVRTRMLDAAAKLLDEASRLHPLDD